MGASIPRMIPYREHREYSDEHSPGAHWSYIISSFVYVEDFPIESVLSCRYMYEDSVCRVLRQLGQDTVIYSAIRTTR